MTMIEEQAQKKLVPTRDLNAMSDAEYQDYIGKWIGIPWLLNGTDPKVGLDCRTLAIQFLKGQGIGVKEDDGKPLPDRIEDIDVERYEKGVKAAGGAVNLSELRRNDVVYFRNKHGRLHIGIWLGYNKMLTTDAKTGSIIIRMKSHWLRGAVRGKRGAWLEMPPGHDPVTAFFVAIGTAVTAGAATGTAALIIGAVTVISTVASIGFGIAAAVSGRKSFNFDTEQSLTSSPRYSFDGARNIRSNQYPVPLIYGAGPIRVLQTYEIWNSGQGAETQKRIVVVGEGELGSITDVELNGDPIGNFPGSSASVYVGTATQGIDSRASSSNIKSLRHRAYIALTLEASKDLSGDPLVTCKVTGRKIAIWNGTDWTTASLAASGNPAAIVRDYLTLSRERGGCGFPASRIDDASFGEVYDWAEVLVSNGQAGTEPRARLDFTVDSFRPWLDNLQDMLATFGGFLITDGRKFFLKVEKDEAPVQSFTDDNITQMSYETFSKEDRPNRIIGVYIDPSDKGNDARTRISVDDLSDQDRNPRGINPREVNFLGLQRQSQCIREITKILNDVRVNWYTIHFLTDINAIALEPGDVFQVKHPVLGDGTQFFKFRAFRVMEAGNHQVKITAKAFTPSVFDDGMEQQVLTLDYTPPANPFTPIADVTNLTVTAVGFLQADGTFFSNLQITWTEPVNTLNLKHYVIEWSQDSGPFEEKMNVFPGETTAVIPGAKVGSSYQVKVRTMNKFDVKSGGVTSASVLVNGDTAPPLDVTGFAVSFAFDHLHFTWNENPDVDMWSYEIREGFSWELGTVIATKITENAFDLFAISPGTRTYWIKAIDLSENFSTNAASDGVTITSVPETNIVLTHDEFKEGIPGALGGEAMLKYTKSFDSTVYRRAIGLRSNPRWADKTGTWAQAQTAGDIFGKPLTTLNGTYTSTVIDIGAKMAATVTLNLSIANIAGGVLTVEIDISDDNVVWAGFKTFSSGMFTGRYFKFRLTFKTTNTQNDVEIYGFVAVFDVPDLIQSGSGVSVVAGGTTIAFPQAFNADASKISIVVTSVGSALVPEIVSGSVTKSQFQVKLKDIGTNTYVAGTANWSAKAF